MQQFPAGRQGGMVARQPYIVSLTGSITEFRIALRSAVPLATVGQELPGGRVVVVVPAGLDPNLLRALPAVRAVEVDNRHHTLRPGSAGAAGN